MKKILVLTEGNIYERRGFFNAVVNRTTHLKDICEYDINVLIIATYEPWLVRKFRHTKKQAKRAILVIDGLKMRIKWNRFSIIDYIINNKLHKDTIFKRIYNTKIAKSLAEYDLIIAHSFNSGMIAMQSKYLYGTPYTVTWHGSDIHTAPLNNAAVVKHTANIIENADANFFVSKALMATSDKITKKGNKQILYNGYNEIFKQYTNHKRELLKKKYNIVGKKIVAYAGGFLAVKNILTIPLIFKDIFEKFHNVEFWMIGDGKFKRQVEKLSTGLPVIFWGNQEPESMPDFFNVSNVLILPSLNEGLPLTIVEGLASGCNVVASLVGGIPEVLDKEYCVNLEDKDFITKFADKVVFFLTAKEHIKQNLNPEFDWNETAKKELKIINTILNK